MHYLCIIYAIGLPSDFRQLFFDSVGTEFVFEVPIRNPSVFGSEPKLMLPLRSDGHPSFFKYFKTICTCFSCFFSNFEKIKLSFR